MDPVQADRRIAAPVLPGISGSQKMMCSMSSGLVCDGQGGARNRVLERRERGHGRGCVVIEAQGVHVEGVHRENVAVWAVTGGRRGTKVGGLARITAQVECGTVEG